MRLDSDDNRRHTGARIAACAVAAALLCGPALWNGFPLVYDDVGGYLERWPTGTLGLGRSVVYGLLLWVTAPGWWIPVIVLQAAVTTFVIDRALALLAPDRPPWTIIAAVALMAATSGVAFFVAQTIPDAWAAPAVLALHLVAWHGDELSRAERAALAAVVAFAGAAHMAILGLLIGLAAVYLLARLGGRRLGVAPQRSVAAAAATCAGAVLVLAADLLVGGRFALTPGGDVFLFGRLTESGIVRQVLDADCPRDDWKLCAFKAELPGSSDDLLWGDDSPLSRIGGWDDPRALREIRSIIWRSLLTHPFAHVRSAATLSVRQFFALATTNNMAPIRSPHLRTTLERYAPHLVAPFDRSRQQQGTIELTGWSAWIVVPVSLAGCLALPLVAVVTWRRGRRRDAMLPAMIFLALVGNAVLCGVVSGPSDRYQARVAWLAPLAAALAVVGKRKADAIGNRAAIRSIW